MKTSLQTLKKHARKSAEIYSGFNTDTRGNRKPVAYTYREQFQNERFAHEVGNLSRKMHTGWYTNEHGETSRDGWGLCRGIVATFPARPGFPDGWSIAGYDFEGNERTWFFDVFTDAEEAARAADGHAERIAEAEREYSTRWNEAHRIHDDIEEKKQRVGECFALRNNPRFPDIREECRETIESIRGKLETLKTDFSDIDF